MASTISLDSGPTWLAKDIARMPLRSIRYLWKFQRGRSPRGLGQRGVKGIGVGGGDANLGKQRKINLIVAFAEVLYHRVAARLLTAEIVGRKPAHEALRTVFSYSACKPLYCPV